MFSDAVIPTATAMRSPTSRDTVWSDCWVAPTCASTATAPGICECTMHGCRRACSRRARWVWASPTWTAGGTPRRSTACCIQAARRATSTSACAASPIFWTRCARVCSTCRSRSRSFEVGERHYDLGNDLYRAMLGKRMVYSCGYWREARLRWTRPRRPSSIWSAASSACSPACACSTSAAAGARR